MANELGDVIDALRRENKLSWKDLADQADVDPATLRRLRAGTSRPHEATLERIGDALGNRAAVLGAAANGDRRVLANSFERTTVAALDVRQLNPADRATEFEIYLASASRMEKPIQPPAVIASAERLKGLEVLNPFPWQILRRVAEAFAIEAPVNIEAPKEWWEWFDAVRIQFVGGTQDVKMRVAQIEALEELASYLAMVSEKRPVALRNVDVVFVLCGRTDHANRVKAASAVCRSAIGDSPTVVVLGSPARLTTESLLSEPDAVWHSLVVDHEADISTEHVRLDGRAKMFVECAFLSIGHLLSVSDRQAPFSVALVAGSLPMRRAFFAFTGVLSNYDHLVKSIHPLAVHEPPTFPAKSGLLSSRWTDELFQETKRLFVARFNGLM